MTLSPIHWIPVQDKESKILCGKLGAVKSLEVTVSIKNTWPSILGVLVTDDSCSFHLWGSVRDGGANVGQQEQPGGEAGILAHLLTHSVSHRQFMFQTLQQLVRMVLYLGCKGQRAVTSLEWRFQRCICQRSWKCWHLSQVSEDNYPINWDVSKSPGDEQVGTRTTYGHWNTGQTDYICQWR